VSPVLERVAVHDGAVIVAVHHGAADPAALWGDPRAEGAQRVCVVLPPRREDCVLRLRTFTRAKELPRSVEGALAVAALRGEGGTFEEGVTATRVLPADRSWQVEVPPVVVGTQDLDDPGLAARALGLALDALDPARPVRAVSCGPNVMVIPVVSPAALRSARLDPAVWREVLGKARHDAALVAHVEATGEVSARSLTAEDARGEDPVSGLGAAALAGYLDAIGGRTPGELRVGFGAHGAVWVRVEGLARWVLGQA
jgi:predicted PhzF superfamily epimerase YddE/YHI9